MKIIHTFCPIRLRHSTAQAFKCHKKCVLNFWSTLVDRGIIETNKIDPKAVKGNTEHTKQIRKWKLSTKAKNCWHNTKRLCNAPQL